MHELGLCEGIVDAVARRAGERPVARVRVRVGALHHVHPEAFAQSFALAATGTVAEGAEAELVLLPVTARCRACDSVVESSAPVLSCPACGGLELDHTGGEELLLESLEYRG
jgi:hydrogenase nickel incorporation protein HypA/HybF